jgi:predicted HD phosphohydrolase
MATGSKPIAAAKAEGGNNGVDTQGNSISIAPDYIWDAARDVGALHTRLAPGFVTDTQLDGEARIVTFGSGLVVRELIVDVNNDDRRLVWSAVGDQITHHNGAMQVLAEGDGSRVVWIADVLPHNLAKLIAAMMDEGLTTMKRAMEKQCEET